MHEPTHSYIVVAVAHEEETSEVGFDAKGADITSVGSLAGGDARFAERLEGARALGLAGAVREETGGAEEISVVVKSL